MTEKISLKDLERGLFKESIQDGILDIQIGLLLLMFVLPIYLSPALGDFWASAVFLPVWFLVIFGFRAYRKKVVQPRIGSIKYGTYRKKRLIKLNIIFVIVNVVALILGFYLFFNFSALGDWGFPAGISIFLLIGFSLAGYMMETPRLYLYGILISAGSLLGEYLYQNHGFSHHGLPITFGSLSVLLVAIGLIILTRLLRKYPPPPEENLV